MLKKEDEENSRLIRYSKDYLKEVTIRINKYGVYYALRNGGRLDRLMDMIRLDELIT